VDRQELATRINDVCRLTGRFELRSGRVTDHYFDKYLFEADPVLLAAVAEQAAELIPDGTEVLAGLELGGIPVATALSLITGIPAAYVRKSAKPYGTMKLAEGASVDGRRVLVVEDVVTTGGQVVQSTDQLREQGAKVDQVLCVIDRSGGNHTALVEASLKLRSLFTSQDLNAAP
jgi:orotate phosphoribosyltransferase